MDYILDTHTLLWALFEPQRLSQTVRGILEDSENRIFVSSISYWEISLKHGLGKLSLPLTDPSEIPKAAFQQGFTDLPAAAEIMSTFHKLPLNPGHRDPFDRLIIWQAISEKLTLLSKDRAMSLYMPHGLSVLW